MELSVVFSISASFIALCVFVYYNYDILRVKTETKPNLVSWLLWLGVTLINSLSYFSMNGDAVKGLTIFTDCLCCVFTTGAILCKKELRGKLEWQSIWEKRAGAVGILSLVAWGVFRSSTVGNQVLQFGYTMSFMPMYLGLLKDPKRERPVVWFCFTFAFVLAFVAATLRWRGHWEDLCSPGLQILLHAIAGCLASRNTNKPETT